MNSNPNGKSKYVMLRSNQLVGAALIIFVKADIVENIRYVETSIKKVCGSIRYSMGLRFLYRQVSWALLVIRARWQSEWITTIRVFVFWLPTLLLVQIICAYCNAVMLNSDFQKVIQTTKIVTLTFIQSTLVCGFYADERSTVMSNCFKQYL